MNPDSPIRKAAPSSRPRSWDVFKTIGSSGFFAGEYVAMNAAHAAELAANERSFANGTKLVVVGVMDHGEPCVSLYTVDTSVHLIKGHA